LRTWQALEVRNSAKGGSNLQKYTNLFFFRTCILAYFFIFFFLIFIGAHGATIWQSLLTWLYWAHLDMPAGARWKGHHLGSGLENNTCWRPSRWTMCWEV